MPISYFKGVNPVSDDAYGASWNGVTGTGASKNAIYDKIETIPADIAAVISDDAYGAGWDGVTTVAPSKNAVYDEVSKIKTGAACYEYSTSQGVNAGQISPVTTYYSRTIDNLIYNNITGFGVSSKDITFPVGLYTVEISCPVGLVGKCRVRLYNYSTSVAHDYGDWGDFQTSDETNYLYLSTIVNVTSSPQIFHVQLYTTLNSDTGDGGYAANISGEVEHYTRINVIKHYEG